MRNNKVIFWLSVIVIILFWFSAGAGLFYSNAGQPRIVENIYGETVRLFGDGVYENNSMLKTTTAKGSDLVMLLVSVCLLATTLRRDKGVRARLLHSGFLAPVLYYSATTAFGVTYSRMFVIYLLLFSAAFFTTVVSIENFIDRVFQGEALSYSDFAVPIQDLVERGLTEEKPFETGFMDVFCLPA